MNETEWKCDGKGLLCLWSFFLFVFLHLARSAERCYQRITHTYRIHILFPSISIYFLYFWLQLQHISELPSRPSMFLALGSRFILRSAHLFCFPLCFGFGGGLIIIIAVVIIVCCSFGLGLRFGLWCLGKLEKHRKQNQKQRCSLCNPTTTTLRSGLVRHHRCRHRHLPQLWPSPSLWLWPLGPQKVNQQTNKQTTKQTSKHIPRQKCCSQTQVPLSSF